MQKHGRPWVYGSGRGPRWKTYASEPALSARGARVEFNSRHLREIFKGTGGGGAAEVLASVDGRRQAGLRRTAASCGEGGAKALTSIIIPRWSNGSPRLLVEEFGPRP